MILSSANNQRRVSYNFQGGGHNDDNHDGGDDNDVNENDDDDDNVSNNNNTCNVDVLHTCISSTQLWIMGCLDSSVYSSHIANIGRARIGVSQLDVAVPCVMPLAVGHVSSGCSPSGPGITVGSSGTMASSGSRSSSSSDSVDVVSRFFL